MSFETRVSFHPIYFRTLEGLLLRGELFSGFNSFFNTFLYALDSIEVSDREL